VPDRWVRWFVSVGPLGSLPASGTWGSAVGLAIAWFTPKAWLPLTAVALTAAALAACAPARRAFRTDDPHPFILDEVCGMIITLLGFPNSPQAALSGFLLFRVLDVWKPWPISRLQADPHPRSILTDDLAAGLLANLVLRILPFVPR
jgi:phosphatidylglycerophosphatase A